MSCRVITETSEKAESPHETLSTTEVITGTGPNRTQGDVNQHSGIARWNCGSAIFRGLVSVQCER
jgi:hypothetical protein